MDSYCANQATSLPHFSGYYRQRGSGFGALAAGIGRVALPIARHFIADCQTYWKGTVETERSRATGRSKQ